MKRMLAALLLTLFAAGVAFADGSPMPPPIPPPKPPEVQVSGAGARSAGELSIAVPSISPS
jgi:hypothetical protein